MERLQFKFSVNSSEDGKSNILAITSITTQDGRCYKIPYEWQTAGLHKSIITTSVFQNVKNTLKKRHATRNVWIKVDEQIKKEFWDEDENIMIKGEYPEEISNIQPSDSVSEQGSSIAEEMAKAMQIIMKTQKTNERPSLRKLSEKFVLEKFCGKGNANEWLKSFEKECKRLEITRDEEKIEIIKPFLEKSCLDWYSGMLMKLTINSEWTDWADNFCTTYANKGWSSSRYALSFKYQTGSLLDYALKKEKLLLELRHTTDQGTLIDIIAAGLPDWIADRINREEVLETKELFKEIGRLEYLVNKKFPGNKKWQKSDPKNSQEDIKACQICAKLNKKNRYHPEASCWFKNYENTKEKNHFSKNTNNSVIEAELDDTDQKNV